MKIILDTERKQVLEAGKVEPRDELEKAYLVQSRIKALRRALPAIKSITIGGPNVLSEKSSIREDLSYALKGKSLPDTQAKLADWENFIITQVPGVINCETRDVAEKYLGIIYDGDSSWSGLLTNSRFSALLSALGHYVEQRLLFNYKKLKSKLWHSKQAINPPEY